MTVVVTEGGGGGSTGSGMGSLVKDLLPIALLLGAGYLAYKMLFSGAGDTSGSGGGGSQGNPNAVSGGPNVGTGTPYIVPVVTPIIFPAPASALNREPENLGGGGSWTRYAVPAALPAWSPPGMIAMVSGRDQPIAGQTALYNPDTGNAWGGNTDTMQFLYTSMAPEAVAWRARYG